MKAEFLAFTAAILVASVSAYPISYTSEGHLQITNAENHVLEAIFFTTETGIQIYGDNKTLTVMSMSNDEVLLAGRIASDSSRLYTVAGTNFLQQTTTDENGERRKVSFVVPESLADQVKEEVEARKEERVTSQLHGQSESEVQTAQEMAFQQLLARPEIALIEPAAKALGRAGVTGYENHGALNFYAVAMALVKQQHREREEGSGEGSGDYDDPECRPRCWEWRPPLPGQNTGGRYKRWWWSRPSIPEGYRRCSRSSSTCLDRDCTKGYSSCNGLCTDWENCEGRCGPGCWWCWSWICGSCCYHHGCYQHDVCCTSYFSLSCAIPIGFSCDSYYCY